MPPVGRDAKPGRAYWRSLDGLADTPEYRRFVEREFPEGASELVGESTRRTFLKLMGASAALAGLASCRWPREEILPFASRAEGFVPGEAMRFATSMELGGVGHGLLVTSFDGRPVKIEGNPLHPGSLGAAGTLAQASILGLYDPDRSRNPVAAEGGRRVSRTWAEAEGYLGDLFGRLGQSGGQGLRVLAAPSSSPTLAAWRGRLLDTFPEARWHEYEPLSRDNEREGSSVAFGRSLRTHLALDRARVIVALEADPLGSHPNAVRQARDFAAGRRPQGGEMSRLYAVESTHSITGGMADHRLPLAASALPALVVALLAELVDRQGVTLPGPLAALQASLKGAGSHGPHGELIKAMARDLAANRGRGLVVVGPRMPAEVQALVHLVNGVLGNAGETVRYTEEPDADRPSSSASIADLVSAMRDGSVQGLLILGGNPAYDAPADLEFTAALSSVDHSVRLGLYDDETSRACRWHLPEAHYLESWSDARAWDGTLGIAQPLIEPFYAGRTAAELLAGVLGESRPTGHELVQRTFERTAPAAAGGSWRRALHEGVVAGTAWPELSPALDAGALRAAVDTVGVPAPSASAENLEAVFLQDVSTYDGRFANNGWLQELPDPLSKMTWDNAALLGPATAAALGVASGDLVSLELDGRRLEIAAFVVPGQAGGSVGLPLGYGRSAAGRVSEGAGFDTYRLRGTGAMDMAGGLRLERTGRRYELATTQDHHTPDQLGKTETERRVAELVREGTLEEYREHPDFAEHRVHTPPLTQPFGEFEYDGNKWGMAIDLNACIGCGACTVACQAENNIPIVGKEQVAKGREMHWIRMDRYFKGDPESPEVVHQPVPCMHCENAPCEQVCPVAATQHDDEGLNVMVYNRCIGTRYCANNCPYKVRRFNFFNYQKGVTELENLQHNPDVTVRSRGVMEKCTYCTQRIQSAKIQAKNERRGIRDGEVVPACAQTCPTQAIVFGNLNDGESRVVEAHADERAYAMLDHLNVRPRTLYLARLRNPASPSHGPAKPERNSAKMEH